ncbi:MAG: transglycosylase SLT domain-containing protein [Myxococcaceae bacterium]
MIRLNYVSPDYGDRTATFNGAVVRFGTDLQVEVRLRAGREPTVARVHGEFVFSNGACLLVANDASTRIWLNGELVTRAKITGGERIRVGSQQGPEIRVLEVALNPPAPEPEEEDRTVSLTQEQLAALHRPKPSAEAPLKSKPSQPANAKSSASRVSAPRVSSPVLAPPPVPKSTSGRKPHKEVQQWLLAAEKEIQRRREATDGDHSGHTMVIMARAMTGLRQAAEGRTQRWRKILGVVALTSVVVVGLLVAVIGWQQKRIASLVREKAAIDVKIADVQEQMAQETDEGKLAELEGQLLHLVGSAKEKVVQVRKTNQRASAELEAPADQLEADIRTLLRSFNAETYAIPPIFKRTLGRMVAELAASSNLRNNFAQKEKYWPAIEEALRARELPVELGYITFTESRFDPSVTNGKSGAAGMWQFMPATGRECGLVVTPKRDERYNPERSSQAAACYLSKLLIEFGQESFMLVLASYNRGENGVRSALHRIAREPGGFKKRDFWHLYRLKLLPEETRDYVPRVMAAAIVFENPERYRPKN